MRIIKLKCELDQANQTVREVAVESEDENNWYGKPVANPACFTCSGPSSLGRKLNKKGLGKRVNARLAQAPTFNPYRRKIDATKP